MDINYIAESFQSPVNRSAEAAIRGYVYQVDVTIQRWLGLSHNEFLELECGEDIDRISENGRIMEQIKDVQSKKLTLVSGINSVINFVKHSEANPTQNLYFLYTTTASLAMESEPQSFFRGQPAIKIWEQIHQKNLPEDISLNQALKGIRNILLRYSKKETSDFQDFILNIKNEDLCRIIERFQWSYDNLSSNSMTPAIKEFLREKYSFDRIKAEEIYNRLFLYVFKILTKSGIKHLAIDKLTEQIECPTLSDKDKNLLQNLSIQFFHFESRLYSLEGDVRNLLEPRNINHVELLDQHEQLERLKQSSKERFVYSFRSIIGNEDTAINIANDSSIWASRTKLDFCHGKVNYLVGNVGIGKTAIAECIYQEALEKFEVDKDAPIPVYLESEDWGQRNKPIKRSIEEAIYGLGNPNNRGVIAILDGLDQIDIEIARDIPKQANLLLVEWDKTTIIITSRPIRLLEDVGKKIEVPMLSEKQSYELIAKVSGRQMTAMICSRWTIAIREAICYPLFALVMARYLKQDLIDFPQSTDGLISWLVGNALAGSKVKLSNCEHLLQQLALQSIENGGGWVRASDVAKSHEIKLLLDSGLIITRSKDLRFPLQILNEWFAAKSLEENPEKVKEFVDSPQQLEKWRYPLIIAAESFGFDVVSEILMPIVEKSPVFAIEIILKASSRWGKREMQLHPFCKCGKMIHKSMQSWVKGLGNLAELTVPIQNDGKVCPIGVKTDGARLETAWYIGNDLLEEDIVELPEDWDDDFSNRWLDWRNGMSSYPSDESAWAWRWTIEIIGKNLSNRLQFPILSVNSQPLIKEAAWRCASAIMRHKSENAKTEPNFDGLKYIAIKEIVETVSEIEAAVLQHNNITLRGMEGLNVQRYFINLLKSEIGSLREINETKIYNPYPIADLFQGMSWRMYSRPQLNSRVEMVYKNALDAYQSISHTWFNQMIPNMRISAMLPARLVGIIVMPMPDESSSQIPSIEWFCEPLPKNSENEVEITFIERINHHKKVYDNRRESAMSKIKSLRPKYAIWMYNDWHKEALDNNFFLHSPATKIAYSWLREDLIKIFGFNTFPYEIKTN